MPDDKEDNVYERIQSILEERPQSKMKIKCSQSEVLRTNNLMSISLIKVVLKTSSVQKEYIKFASDVIRYIDQLKVEWVKDRLSTILSKIRENKKLTKRPSSDNKRHTKNRTSIDTKKDIYQSSEYT